MREELVERLYTEFDKDREIIKQNLTKVMDSVGLSCDNDYEKITMLIKIERRKKKDEIIKKL